LRINGRIKAKTVRLIAEENEQLGIMETIQALNRAHEAGLDLVEVAPTSDPPVCRIMDYGKWLYEQKRKTREAQKKHQRHSATLKEIRLRPETDKHDLEMKLKHGREFLEKGHKLQFTMFFRGRQMLHRDCRTRGDYRIFAGFSKDRAAGQDGSQAYDFVACAKVSCRQHI
jgi:translation initiation factor IF-3